MSQSQLLNLMGQSLTRPRDVAQWLLALQVPAQGIWLSFGLVLVLNAFAQVLAALSLDSPTALSPILGNPIVFMALLGLSMLIEAFVLSVSGRVLGGQGSWHGMLRVVIWFQLLRFAAELLVSALILLSPSLGTIAAFAALFAGLWIVVNFIDVAHDLNSLAKAFMTLILGFMGLLFGLSFLMALLGVDNTLGQLGYV